MPSSDESDSPSSTPSTDQPPPSPPDGSSSISPPPSNESPRSQNKSSPSPPATPGSSSSSRSTPTSLAPKSQRSHEKLSLPGHHVDDSFSKRAAVGAAVGIGLIFFIWIIIYIVRSRRKKKEKTYYGDEKGKDYHGSKHSSNYYSSQKGEHVVRMKEMGSWDAKPPFSRATNNTESSYNFSLMPSPQPPPPPTPQGTFCYEELKSATNGFDEKNLLGQGGFGYVHRGVLPNGKEIAVKSLKTNSGQGEIEFQTEVDVISRVHHRHLVSLVGYCISGRRRLLVYEFVPNKTLEYHLHEKAMPTMDWSTRLRIAIGSGRGLAYLHEDCNPRIIHRDIKASNILLDEYFEPKVADFGLAKLTNDNNTHVSTRVMGTFGYLAPEYASSGRLTEKSDVYSYGVMLLELITGKQPTGDIMNAHEDGIVDWARPLLNSVLQDGNFRELVDPFLEGNYNVEEMMRMAHCASASIRHSSKRRPRMSQIVRVLEGVLSLEDLSSN